MVVTPLTAAKGPDSSRTVYTVHSLLCPLTTNSYLKLEDAFPFCCAKGANIGLAERPALSRSVMQRRCSTHSSTSEQPVGSLNDHVGRRLSKSSKHSSTGLQSVKRLNAQDESHHPMEREARADRSDFPNDERTMCEMGQVLTSDVLRSCIEHVDELKRMHTPNNAESNRAVLRGMHDVLILAEHHNNKFLQRLMCESAALWAMRAETMETIPGWCWRKEASWAYEALEKAAARSNAALCMHPSQ